MLLLEFEQAADSGTDDDADAIGIRLFESVFDVTGTQFMFRVRLTDPLERASERLVRGTIQPIDQANLADLRLRRNLRDLLILFSSTTPTRRPPTGAFRLAITFVRRTPGLPVRLLAAALHEIPAGDLNIWLPTSPITTIVRSSATSPPHPNEYGAVIKNFFPSGPLQPPPQGLIQVTLTAPDGTSVRVDAAL